MRVFRWQAASTTSSWRWSSPPTTARHPSTSRTSRSFCATRRARRSGSVKQCDNDAVRSCTELFFHTLASRCNQVIIVFWHCSITVFSTSECRSLLRSLCVGGCLYCSDCRLCIKSTTPWTYSRRNATHWSSISSDVTGCWNIHWHGLDNKMCTQENENNTYYPPCGMYLHVYTPDVDDFCTWLVHASNAGHCGAVFNTNAIHVRLTMQPMIMMRARLV